MSIEKEVDNIMAESEKGVTYSSQHGFVDIKFHNFFGQDSLDKNSKFITTLSGPDNSVLRIITDSLSDNHTWAANLRNAIDVVLRQNFNWADDILAEEEAEHHRWETPLDENATSELWSKAEPRYWVELITTDYPGYKKMTFHLFHTEMTIDEMKPLIVLAPGRTMDDFMHSYATSSLEQTFSKEEVYQLYKYFSSTKANTKLKAKRTICTPDNNSMGYGAYPVGGVDDFYMFSREDGYNLPFSVYGYFRRDEDENVNTNDDLKGLIPGGSIESLDGFTHGPELTDIGPDDIPF